VVLAVEAAQFLCILGPSGCGKTTLLNLIAGLDQDFEGRISIERGPGGDEPRIGYVFQEPALLPWRTVIENLRLVMGADQIARDLDLALLDAMGLLDYRDAYPKSLSLGMSRRVALARAFAVEPDLLLMDEPFVSLDESTADGLRRLLLQTWQAKPTTVLFVTHDSREAIQLAQRIIVLCAPPATIIRDQSVALTADQRADPLQREALRAQFLSEDVLVP
jgi:NitT/TauT family transport system ATP-binding protein